MKEQQQSYNIFDKELLVIINALEAWQQLLGGAAHPVEILLDHQNLTYWTMVWDLTHRQARWPSNC